jgi:hypothetical protein
MTGFRVVASRPETAKKAFDFDFLKTVNPFISKLK